MSNKLGLKKQRERAGYVIPELHVYSAGCSWHGPITAVGKTPDLPITMAKVGGTEIPIGGPGSGLPCCPHCGSMLFQTEEKKWWEGAKEHEKAKHPNYVRFLNWTAKQKRCWENNTVAAAAYNKARENWDYEYKHNV